ncbi:MAG: hypothetical protein HYZ58_03635 [Acidobacteria bacterium]|nr:hypothetical protein [Acidobacteriota bacterium]
MAGRSARHRASGWRTDPRLWVEVFVVVNFAALVVDIFLAHSQNRFRRDSEYIPLYFSIVATFVLVAIVPLRFRLPAVWRDVGHLIGWAAVVVGLVGVVLHLDSRFFHERTIRSLTYAAPFAAPLAYAGLGFLLIANRLVDPATVEWAQWMLLLALGGFAGNFVFSLTDHAQNGFFNPAEWIPVVSSALATGFLTVPFLTEVRPGYLWICVAVLGIQGLVGLVGFVFHAAADLRQPASTLLERILNGAPPMAPLLFPNLVILGLMALWALARHVDDEKEVVQRADRHRHEERPRAHRQH